MPKLFLFFLSAAVGALATLRRARAHRAEQDLWAEATAPTDLR